MFHRTGENGPPSLVSDLRGKEFNPLPISMILAVTIFPLF